MFLGDLPTAGHDVRLELIGIATGLVLGTLAALLTRVHHRDGHLLVRAGAAFAAVWVSTIGGRMLFAQWATHGGARTISDYVYAQYIAKQLYPDAFKDVDPAKNLEDFYRAWLPIEAKGVFVVPYKGVGQ